MTLHRFSVIFAVVCFAFVGFGTLANAQSPEGMDRATVQIGEDTYLFDVLDLEEGERRVLHKEPTVFVQRKGTSLVVQLGEKQISLADGVVKDARNLANLQNLESKTGKHYTIKVKTKKGQTRKLMVQCDSVSECKKIADRLLNEEDIVLSPVAQGEVLVTLTGKKNAEQHTMKMRFSLRSK